MHTSQKRDGGLTQSKAFLIYYQNDYFLFLLTTKQVGFFIYKNKIKGILNLLYFSYIYIFSLVYGVN